MGVVEDLYDEVRALRNGLERLCRKVGHEYADGAYPKCSRHRDTANDANSGSSCDVCGTFLCCEES